MSGTGATATGCRTIQIENSLRRPRAPKTCAIWALCEGRQGRFGTSANILISPTACSIRGAIARIAYPGYDHALRATVRAGEYKIVLRWNPLPSRQHDWLSSTRKRWSGTLLAGILIFPITEFAPSADRIFVNERRRLSAKRLICGKGYCLVRTAAGRRKFLEVVQPPSCPTPHRAAT